MTHGGVLLCLVGIWVGYNTPRVRRLFQLFIHNIRQYLCKSYGIEWSFCLDESRAAACDLRTGIIHVHDMVTGKHLWQSDRPLSPLASSTFSLSPDGKMVAAWAEDWDVRIWDLQTARHRKLQLEPALKGREKSGTGRVGEAFEVCLAWSPDSRMLAIGGLHWDNSVYIWEVSSAQLRCKLSGHDRPVQSLGFSRDNEHLVSASQDTTVLVWKIFARARPCDALNDDDLSALWKRLASEASDAYAAQTSLLHAPARSVPFLAKYLQPVPAIDPKRVSDWINGLDAEEFPVREKAMKELEHRGELVRQPLERALNSASSVESRQRLERLVLALDRLKPSELQQLRAIEVLERIGTPEAFEIIQRVSKGNPDSLATAEGRKAIARRILRVPVSLPKTSSQSGLP